ncbi:hypothetical protein PROFUN_15989 [Planoprotostelium fungivorum]|uniref:Uncharacterized protein n=1 Tax=Planoprotostelium fungivorum TaxID=1890364 RepID=A0A2P6MTF0_9EUKA|nr:hypothetical protein PROFUN_15989 [Planoprotostelium fungivorum]
MVFNFISRQRFPHSLQKASAERTNAYKCFAEDHQTEHRRRAFSARDSLLFKLRNLQPAACCDFSRYARCTRSWDT